MGSYTGLGRSSSLIARRPIRPAVPEPIACGLCGRDFAPRRTGSRRYCAPCMARVARESSSEKRAKCRECGGAFPTRNLSVRYCSDACRERSHPRYRRARGRPGRPSGEATAKCRACGRSFPTPSRAVRYCSDPCRKDGYARYHHIQWRPRRANERTAKCRVCGKDFATDMGPGKPRVYCSAACRADGTRARNREYMRRYFEDPERRAMQAVRTNAASARRRAAGKGG